MGKCKYCGKPAGFLKNKHQSCVEEHNALLQKRAKGYEKVSETIREGIIANLETGIISKTATAAAAEYELSDADKEKAIVRGWEECVDFFLEDGVLSQEEEHSLASFSTSFGLTQAELDINGSYTKIVKARVLRDLLDGTVNSDRINVTGTLPFNFMKSEKTIWVFTDVDYYEQKTRRQYVGGSSGVSIRIAKGIYFRTSAFKGHPIETTETVYGGTGILCITTKHIYYYGGDKPFRIRHNKIVSIEPHSDGVTLQRDAATAKPQSFITDDGWFTYNIMMNAGNI